MKRGRFIYEKEIKDMQLNGSPIKLGIYGIFDPKKSEWAHYYVSFYNDIRNQKLTDDICSCSYPMIISMENVIKYGIKISDINKCKSDIEDFSEKWNTGTNDTKSIMRDNKLNDLLSGS